MEDALLAGSGKAGAELPGGSGAKAFNGDFDEFSDEFMWGDETDENNE